jgi:catechol 2,3-dioxygenase-like lactoylglutathione lyase family enzyme
VGTGSSPLESGKLSGFAATVDPAGSRQFYEGKLGFRVVSDDGLALVLDANGQMIRVQKLKKHSPQPFTILGWNVPDIVSTVRALGSCGVACEHYGFPFQDGEGIATFSDGTRVAWFKDPDGNILSIAQFPRSTFGSPSNV